MPAFAEASLDTRSGLALVLSCVALSCGRSPALPAVFGVKGAQAAFDLDADTTRPGAFWNLPWPSDLRLDGSGRARLEGFPNPRGLPLIEAFRREAMERRGFPVLPVADFRFSQPIARVSADRAPAALLIDLERSDLVPTLAATPPPDDYVPPNFLAVAPQPGFVLASGRKYAFVVLRSLGDAAGAPLGVSPAFDQLRRGGTPDGALGAAARALYAPLWPALANLHIDPLEVAAATVFTTGDAVAETAALTDALKARHSVALENLALADESNDRLCLFRATVRFPQFQQGAPPFDTQGLFAPDASGLPVQQREEAAPVVLSIPRTPMPARGYPLAIYFHGSGGSSSDLIDKGPTLVAGGQPQKGLGPGWVLAGHGIASAASALPVNPERLRGAGETAYLNFRNLPAMRDTFRQGVVEQRLLLEALASVRIPATSCNAEAFFDPDALVSQGQSMGGMYANLVSAVEPRIKAVVPTGAGGFWTWFVLITKLHDGLPDLVAALLGTASPVTFLHPALQLIEMSWEPADPFVAMPRLSRRPLPGHPARPVYEPVGEGDQYFPTQLYDAAALAYGHNQAGIIYWPTMQDALAQAHLDGVRSYPAQQNRLSENGRAYTGIVVQYPGDGIEDPHAIYRQLDAVKHQYGCFLESFLRTGVAVVPAPDSRSCAGL